MQLEGDMVRFYAPPRDNTSAVLLHEMNHLTDLCKASPRQPTAHNLLYEYATGTQLVGPQLFEVGHLSSAKEYLRLSELVLVVVLK